MLHYDSDMLLHQQKDYSWVDEGIKLMEEHPEIMAIRPLAGPPTKDGTCLLYTSDAADDP